MYVSTIFGFQAELTWKGLNLQFVWAHSSQDIRMSNVFVGRAPMMPPTDRTIVPYSVCIIIESLSVHALILRRSVPNWQIPSNMAGRVECVCKILHRKAVQECDNIVSHLTLTSISREIALTSSQIYLYLPHLSPPTRHSRTPNIYLPTSFLPAMLSVTSSLLHC
jgi:hypothetical protein